METLLEPLQDTIVLSSDESTSDSEAESSLEDEVESEIPEPKTISTGLSKFYVHDWTAKEAFRELYQNWKDALIQSFDLDPRCFTPLRRDLKSQIQITIRLPHATPAKGELLGFIRFDKNAGSLQLVNFKAQLRAQHFDLGVSTKRGNEMTAGYHGEGFKLAALILRRRDHRVRFRASSCTWNFNFRGTLKSTLYVKRNPIGEKTQKSQDEYAAKISAGATRGLRANICEDVSVEIRKGRGKDGKRIETEEFLSWISVTLDLQRPSPDKMVKADRGELILDKEFAGQLYLKGLLLSDTNTSRKPFKFGYNFFDGHVDRDRRQLRDSAEEADTLASIWDHAIRNRGRDVLDPLVSMFQSSPSCRDIGESQHRFTSMAAKAIWAHLLSSAGDGFYYNEKLQDKDPELIRKFLEKRPLRLSEPLWNLLRKFDLIRSPDDQRIHLFKTSPDSSSTHTVFSHGVHRALMASLALDPRTKNIQVSYVQSADLGIDFLFVEEESLLKIHEKWLDFQKIHETASCQISRLTSKSASTPQVFVCDHIVSDLYGQVLTEIIANLDLGKGESMALIRTLRHTARDLLQQMPRKVQVMHTGQAHELQVSWMDCDSGLILDEYRHNIQYCVSLHRQSTCPLKALSCPVYNGLKPGEEQHALRSCGCSRQIISNGFTKAIFNNLDPREDYYPTVSRYGTEAFTGLSPGPIKPNPSQSHVSTSANPNHKINGNRPPLSQVNGVLPPVRVGGIRAANTDISPPRNNTFTDCRLSWEQDDKMWKQWREKRLSKIFSNLTPTRETSSRGRSYISSLPCPALDYTFKAGEFTQVRLRFNDDSNEQTFQYIILVHDFSFDEQADGVNKYRLVVSKYSFLKLSTLFNPCVNKSEAAKLFSDRELLLHFQDFDTMGQIEDAEIIRLSDISHAKDPEIHPSSAADTVEHIPQSPDDVSMYNFFCRFAIYASPDPETSCLTPVGSNLLQHRNRWKRPSYKYPCSPSVFDMSPHILGPSEGFSQASYDIHAALGFSPSRDTTWKVRHHGSLVYDDRPDLVLDDICASRLAPPELPGPSIPKIALISGHCLPFLVETSPSNPHDTAKLWLAGISRILKAAATSTASCLGPFDFIVLMMPSAILHEHVYTPFLSDIFSLLTRRYSVHLKLVHFTDYAVPQAREALILLASPVCAEVLWPEKVDSQQKVQDLIRDLASKSPRSSEGGYLRGFVRKYDPSPSSSQVTSIASQNVYNHQPSVLWSKAPPIDLNTKAAEIFGYRVGKTVHPERGDALTIRELARLQGFPDDFTFFGSLHEQTQSIYQAFPPPIAKLVAETIFRSIRQYQTAPIGTPESSEPSVEARALKRPRVDTES